MREFKSIRELCSIVVDCPHSTPRWTKSGKIVVRNNNIKHGRIDFSSPSYTDEEHFEQRIKRAKPQPGDLIITREAPIGDVGMVPENAECCLGQRMVLLRADETVCDNFYLLYSLQSPYVQHQISWSEGTGTTVSNLRIPHLEKIQIPYFPLEQQKRISSILRSLEKRIEINRMINDNLKLQIKEICTAWLTDFRPFGGHMPSSWVETPLSDIAEFISGYSYKGNELATSNIAMATIKNFDRNGGFKVDGYKEIIPSTKLKDSQHVSLFDTLVAHTDLTQNAEVIGNAELVMSKAQYEDIVFSMDLVKVLPKNCGVSKFLIAAILQDKRFKAHCLGYVNGTTVLHLSKKALPEYRLYLPSNIDELKLLDNIITALYKKIASNISEITQLELLRDSLLPKLMCGKIDISSVQL